MNPCTRWPSSYCSNGGNVLHNGEGTPEQETISNWSRVNAGSLSNIKSGRYQLTYCFHTKSVAICWPKACWQERVNISLLERQKEYFKIVKYFSKMHSHWLTGDMLYKNQMKFSQIAHDQKGPGSGREWIHPTSCTRWWILHNHGPTAARFHIHCMPIH
jgi:hypothetical protein